MFSLTRRNALKLMGSAAALAAMPFQKVSALVRPTLHEDVQRTVSKWTPSILDRQLEGAYSKVFSRQKSTMQIERVAHVRYLSLAQMKGRDVKVTDAAFDNLAGQRWVYNFETYEVGLAFAVVDDDDPRAGVPDSERPPSIIGLAHVRQGARTVPWRRRDRQLAIKTMVGMFRDMREENAAAIFNKARTYDPSVVGDGRCLVSSHHPVEGAAWSNSLGLELNAANLETALKTIATTWVDEANLLLNARGRLLVVPRELADIAAGLNFPHVVWDKLTDPRGWFVLTQYSHGLPWFERDPLELDTWRDHEGDMVMVKGYERRTFGCSDPRAVLGSFPT